MFVLVRKKRLCRRSGFLLMYSVAKGCSSLAVVSGNALN
jgi:hypothetical protein